MDCDPIVDLAGQFQPLFKKYRLKGQQSVCHQGAQIHRTEVGLSLTAVRPGQLQHLFHQGPHLPGHGENI